MLGFVDAKKEGRNNKEKPKPGIEMGHPHKQRA